MTVPGHVADPSFLEAQDVTLETAGHRFAAYAARPRQADRLPGVVVIHEAFGVNDHIRDVCRRFAAQGTLAIAPDLFARVGGPPDFGDLQAALAKIAQLADADALADLFTTLAWIRAQPCSTGKVGSIGFCMGGRLSLLLATQPGALDVAIDCWGGRITRRTTQVDERHPEIVIDRVPKLSCPLLGLFGAEDQNPSPEDVAELSAALEAAGKEHRIVIYPGAGHAFFADYRQSYREGPAREAWGEMLAWLARLDK